MDDVQGTWKRVTWSFPGEEEGEERKEAHPRKIMTTTMMMIPLQKT